MRSGVVSCALRAGLLRFFSNEMQRGQVRLQKNHNNQSSVWHNWRVIDHITWKHCLCANVSLKRWWHYFRLSEWSWDGGNRVIFRLDLWPQACSRSDSDVVRIWWRYHLEWPSVPCPDRRREPSCLEPPWRGSRCGLAKSGKWKHPHSFTWSLQVLMAREECSCNFFIWLI